jgi:hypothetical protein
VTKLNPNHPGGSAEPKKSISALLSQSAQDFDLQNAVVDLGIVGFDH